MNLAAIILFTSIINCVFSLTLDIEPKKEHVNINTNVTVLCKSDVALSACQFKWKSYWTEGPLIDLSQGHESQKSEVNLGGDITGYWYYGTGLQNKQCGATFTMRLWGSRVISCRGRDGISGWVYADMTVHVDARAPFTLNVEPSEVVVLPGTNVNLLCFSDGPLNDCTFLWPGKELVRFNNGPLSEATPNMRYYGTGLENGQCGATLLNVNSEANKIMFCSGKTGRPKEHETSSISVIVAKPPSNVELMLSKPRYKEGETMEATCVVQDSLPVANITWFFGPKVIRQDGGDDSPIGMHWLWKNESRTVMQKIVQQVNSEDGGKELRCVVDHVALTNQIIKTRILLVEFQPKCPPLESSTVDIFCVFGGDMSSCGAPMAIGTVAHLQCKSGHLLQPDPGYRQIRCQDNGVWNKIVFTCVLDCGKRNTNAGTTLISNGRDAKMGEFPWHVAIYQKNNDSYAQICGGTLITARLVVTAAHCFWDNRINKLQNSSLYKVAAGKYHREWDIEETPMPSQRKGVKEIIVPARYKGRESNFAVDIAILKLSSAVDITSHVKVICVDWDNLRERFDLRTGQFGTVVGWGYTENGLQSEKLKLLDLPYIIFDTCYQALSSEVKQILTPDKFCAGYVNNSTSVCGGDSGGGIVFQNEASEKYYLRGIVSVSFKPSSNNDICYSQSYTAFTQLSQYRTWVQSFL